MSAPPWEPHPLFEGPHGVVRAVAIPNGPPPPEAMARLTEEERAHAARMSPMRLPTWVAGRLALAAALAEVGAPRAPLLVTPRGAPAVPPGFVGSLSHKRTIAVALAARDEGACVGVDVEDALRHRFDISRRILTEVELSVVDALPEEQRWRAVAARFSVKESIYKALDPFVQRFVGFKEAEVELGAGGEGWATLDLEKGEGPFAVEVAWAEIGRTIVSTARVRPQAPDHDAHR